jgi:hypothetical protein
MSFDNDQRIKAFLSDEARRSVTTAPSLEEMIGVVASRVGRRPAGSSRSLMVLLAASLLLTVALASAIAIGSGLVRLPSNREVPPAEVQAAYEAVFLNLEATAASGGDREAVSAGREVVVVGVDMAGQEREIARIEGGWTTYTVGDGPLAPMGAVSPDGLLAMPSGRPGAMRWHIYDLRDPDAGPLVVEGVTQDVEQLQASPYFSEDMRPSVFWTSGGDAVIPWYQRAGDVHFDVAFVDGQTGEVRMADVPTDRWVLPRAPTDGSGVLLSRLMHEQARWLLARDGSVIELDEPVEAEHACRTGYASGARLEAGRGSVNRQAPDGRAEVLAVVSEVTYACLAPDEQSVVFDIGIGDGTGDVTASSRAAGLIVPGNGDWMTVSGSFAGWMEVDR